MFQRARDGFPYDRPIDIAEHLGAGFGVDLPESINKAVEKMSMRPKQMGWFREVSRDEEDYSTNTKRGL